MTKEEALDIFARTFMPNIADDFEEDPWEFGEEFGVADAAAEAAADVARGYFPTDDQVAEAKRVLLAEYGAPEGAEE